MSDRERFISSQLDRPDASRDAFAGGRSPMTSVAADESQGVSAAALPFFLALAVLFVMAYGGWTWWRVQQFQLAQSQAISAPEIGPPLNEFELTNHLSKPFRSADMRGRVWVATYFFTTCPGSCIRLNQNIQLLHKLPELGDVTWVSITCDPDTDTIDILARYAEQWKADPERWQFCRGDLDYTKRVALGMNLYLDRKGHQDYAVVVDKAGKVRGMFDATSKSDCQRLHALLVECQAEAPPDELSEKARSEIAVDAGPGDAEEPSNATEAVDAGDVVNAGDIDETDTAEAVAVAASERSTEEMQQEAPRAMPATKAADGAADHE